jgi:hypothetical protein
MSDLFPLTVNPLPRFVFIDCEATSLDIPSHPIEVGMAWCDGNSAAYLVQPDVTWEDWVWDPGASRVHGIGREECAAHGKSVAWMADWINQACLGKTVCSDNPEAENYWLGELFLASGRRQAFVIEDAYTLVQAALISAPGGMGAFEGLKRRVQKSHPITHRAADDACFWAVAFREAALLGGMSA